MASAANSCVSRLSNFFFCNRPFYSCCLVTWPMNTSEAGVDLALISSSLRPASKALTGENNLLVIFLKV